MTWPSAMYSFIFEALISSPAPEGARNCRAISTPITATTIQSQGPLNKRFTGFFHDCRVRH